MPINAVTISTKLVGQLRKKNEMASSCSKYQQNTSKLNLWFSSGFHLVTSGFHLVCPSFRLDPKFNNRPQRKQAICALQSEWIYALVLLKIAIVWSASWRCHANETHRITRHEPFFCVFISLEIELFDQDCEWVHSTQTLLYEASGRSRQAQLLD